jgi:FecR protein
MRFLAVGCALGVLAAGSACAQAVISSHSGVVQYVEGRAFLADKPMEAKFGQFPDIKENQEFRTEDGRAEILLTPGTFLRIGENSSIRMLSTRLTDTRVELLSGSAMIECTEMPKDNAVQLQYKNDTVRLEKQGIYRLDSEPAHFKVFEGEAVVNDASGQLMLRSGKETALAGALTAANFDKKPDDQDSLYRWSDRRASYVAQANVASAASANGNGYGGYGGYNGYGSGYGYGSGLIGSSLGYGYNPLYNGGWMFNPLFGMYTYMPYSGFGYSPFGYTYYSPATVAYAPFYGGSGYSYGSSPTGRAGTSSNRLGELATHRGAAASGGAVTTASARSGGVFGSSGGHASFSGGGGGRAGGGHR